MFKRISLLLLLLCISILSFGQSSSTVHRIEIFSKVWGFLKYYHPAVASGQFDWDSIYLGFVPKVIYAKNNAEFNKVVSAIMEQAGRVEKPGPIIDESDSLFTRNRINNGWMIKSEILSMEIKKKLAEIYQNRNQGANQYIKIVNHTADFSGETRYEQMGFPPLEFRLLFLSRFWNIITHFAPYKYLANSWEKNLGKFIPKFLLAKDSISYYKALLELCKSLNDGHSQLSLPEGRSVTDLIYGAYTVPFYCDILNGKVVIRKVFTDSIATSANIQPGDIVLKINGKPCNELIKDRKKYISSSNQSDEYHQLARFILDGPELTASLVIRRGDRLLNTVVKRVPNTNRNWGGFINYTSNEVGYKSLSDSILLIYAMQIWDGNLDTIKTLIGRSKAVIFDVRNYPQNDAFFYIADPFLAEPRLINYSTIAITQSPGLFKWEPAPKIGRFNDYPFKGKVLLLADERTQSQGEYSCMVLQTIPGAVTIGRKTAGVDGVYTSVPLGGGISVSYSGYGIYYPDKTPTQKVGIEIDITVPKTIASIKNNKDEILERALLYLQGH